MPNPTGANSPTAYDQGAATTPYGDKKQQAALQKTAPVAGEKMAGMMLGTPRRAADLAREQAAAQPVAAAPVAPSNPVAETWAQIASDPAASDLVRAYAARAAG